MLSTATMKIPDQLHKQVADLAAGAQKDFKSKGLIIPIKERNGVIKFDTYSIIKKSGFYCITNISNLLVVDRINLAQTAILLANRLALGKWVDDELLEHDRQYGYNLFEEDQYSNIAVVACKKKEWDRVDLLVLKKEIAHTKSESAKRAIMASFEKLRRIR